MLRKETVSPQLLECLTVLMEMETIKAHRLVGGTALSLQLGHRVSVDIDLFSDDKNDYEKIQEELYETFGNRFERGRTISNSFSYGIAIFLNDVKTDLLDWKAKFIRPAVTVEHLRVASLEDIIPMKFNTFLCSPEFARYEKKDFVDIATLLRLYSLEQMMSLYNEKYPGGLLSSRLIIEGLLLNEMADKKVMPKMLNAETWESTKHQIENSIDQFIRSKQNK